MSTSALPRGKSIDVLFADEEEFGVPPEENFTRTFIYSHDLEEKEPFEVDSLLGIARNNNRDMTAPAPGLPTMGGSIVAPLDFNHVGWLLRGAFGDASVTGSADPYTHVFTSGKEVIPTRSIEVKLADDDYRLYDGCFINKLAFDVSRAAGFERITATILGRGETPGTESAGGTPAAPWALSRAPKTLGVFEIGGAPVAFVTAAKAEYDNRAVGGNYVGQERISSIELDDEAMFTGSLDLRFTNSDMYERGVSGDPFAARLVWTLSSGRSLAIAAPAMRLERSGIKVSGPAGINQSFNFRCEQSSSAPMVTATLKSLVPSY